MIMDFLEDAWDYLLDGVDYFISFEWLGDLWDFITSMFEDIGEFSYLGVVFAVLVIAFIYFASPWMLKPFLDHMGKAEKVFWGGATYIGSAILGYIVGKRLWDD